MQDSTIDILVTIDKNYIGPLRVMLRSLTVNDPRSVFRLWLLHSGIPREDLEGLEAYCRALGIALTAVQVDRAVFAEAPVSRRYPQEMYYRLLAPLLLPGELERVLYLDPDILAINALRPLWELSLEGRAFAAASHSIVPDMVDDVNRRRLGTDHAYFNTGVILMDLTAARELVRPADIFTCVREHAGELLLPDQDVFNALYGGQTVQLEDAVWNYDARRFPAYRLNSGGKYDMDWVMENTVFLHFCGKQKPWKPSHTSRFSALYKHYMRLTRLQLEALGQ